MYVTMTVLLQRTLLSKYFGFPEWRRAAHPIILSVDGDFSTRNTPTLRRPLSRVIDFMQFLFLKFDFHYKCPLLYKSKEG